MMPTATCQYCGWNGPADQCGPLKNAWERVTPGEPMPAGACPKCKASALLDETRHEPCIKVANTRMPERATKFGVRSTAQSLADVMWDPSHPWSYRVQDLDCAGFRVAIYRDTPGAARTRTATCGSSEREARETHMHITDIRIDEIVNVTHLPCYARGRAIFDNGRSYPFDANFAHGYGDAAVVVYTPTGGRELKAGTRVHKAILDRLGFPDIAQRERDAIATFEEERVAACRALMRRRPS